jgi:hypothetical protein
MSLCSPGDQGLHTSPARQSNRPGDVMCSYRQSSGWPAEIRAGEFNGNETIEVILRSATSHSIACFMQ